jgi:purine-binding chemotaxis protein CheW
MAVEQITETRTYLTFTLDEEDFGVDVAGVREVLDFTNVTKVPRTPDFMKGVINLRGSVVPVVDMRIKFGLEEAEATVDTCIIVMEVEMEGEATIIGALADSVKEVFELNPDHIEPPPRIGTRLDTEFISGMGKYKDNFIIILDINEVFSAEELNLFKESMDSPAAKNSKPVKSGEAEVNDGEEVSEKTGSEEEPAEVNA